MQVLIVAADPATRQQLEGFFRRRHHDLTVCRNVGEGRTAVAAGAHSIAVVDLEPDLDDALALLREIRHQDRLSAAFLLAVAKTLSTDAMRAALEAGADDFLSKPVDRTALQLRLAIGQRNRSARQRSVETAAGGEQRFRTLLETMREGVFQVDDHGCIDLANSRLSRITGYTTDELLGRRADDILVAPSVRERLPGQTLLGLGTGSEEYTIPLTNKSDESIWVKLTAAPLAGGMGSLGVVQDITAQRNAEESLRHREQYFRVLLENASDLISILDLDGRILYQSKSSERLLGWDPDALIGQDFYRLQHDDDRKNFAQTLQETLKEEGATASVQSRLRHRDRHWCHFESLCHNLIDNPVVGGIVVTSRDVTERRQVEAALQRERALFQQLFHNSPSGIVIIDDADLVVDVNRGFVDLFQFDAAEVTGKPLSDFIVPENLATESKQLSEMVYERRTITHETVRQRKDGSAVDVSVLGYPIELAEGRTGAFGLYTDIGERKRAERKLFHEAFHDALTGLPNRTLLVERLERDLRRAHRRPGYQFALLFIDLDRFKEINDSHGHAAGDQILIDTSMRLEGCLRPGDTTARLAGDEFTVLLEDLQEVAMATRVADRILEELRRPFEIAGQSIEISGSLGLVFGTAGYERAEELIRDADIAMYRAKSRGKACYEIFDAEMQKSAFDRLRLESDLARAIDEQRQQLYYQPIISLATGKIAGFEALVRWRHPERGFLGPSEMIPICDDTGLIHPLGRWIMRQACHQTVKWQKLFPQHDGIQVTVNVSIKQILAPDFVQESTEIAAEAQIKPASIGLEIPESLLADHPESAAILWQLRKQGFRIQIDDYGTGHSSLRELYRSPVDTLKVDRSFVARMKPGGEDLEVVRAAAALGNGLGLAVVAEGVETSKQLAQVRELGLTHAQGFLIAKPQPAEEVVNLIAEDRRW